MSGRSRRRTKGYRPVPGRVYKSPLTDRKSEWKRYHSRLALTRRASAMLPSFRWTKESRDALLLHLGMSGRDLRRAGLYVHDDESRWSDQLFWSLTLLAEQSGFWKVYPQAPRLVLIVVDEARIFLEFCTRNEMNGRRVRWIRHPKQLAAYRVDQIDYMYRIGKDFNSIAKHPKVQQFYQELRAYKRRLAQERQEF